MGQEKEDINKNNINPDSLIHDGVDKNASKSKKTKSKAAAKRELGIEEKPGKRNNKKKQ